MPGRLSQSKAVGRLSGVAGGAKDLIGLVGFATDNTLQARTLLSDYSIKKPTGITFSSGGAVQPVATPASATSPDGNWFVLAYSGGSPTPNPYVQVYRRTGKAWEFFGTMPGSGTTSFVGFFFSADGLRCYGIASGNGSLYRWTLSSGLWTGPGYISPGGGVYWAAESDDGVNLVILYYNGTNGGAATAIYRSGVLATATGYGVGRTSQNLRTWVSPLGNYIATSYFDAGSNGIYWEGYIYGISRGGGYIGGYNYGSTNNVRSLFSKGCWLTENLLLVGSIPTTTADAVNNFVMLHVFNAATGGAFSVLKLCPWLSGSLGVLDIVSLGSSLYAVATDDGSVFVVKFDGNSSVTLVGEGAKLYPSTKTCGLTKV